LHDLLKVEVFLEVRSQIPYNWWCGKINVV